MYKVNSRKLLALVFLGTMSLTACDLPGLTGPTAITPPADVKSITPTENKPVEIKNGSIDNSEVAFQPLINLDTAKVLANYKEEMMAAQKEAYGIDSNPHWDLDIAAFYKFYDAGEIKISPYQGQKLVVLNLQCDGPCMSAFIHRFAWDEKSGKLTRLEKYSNQDYMPDNFAPLAKNSDGEFTIKALELPNSVTLPDGKNSAQLQNFSLDTVKTKVDLIPDKTGYVFTGFVDLGEVAFRDEKIGNVYFGEGMTGCLYVVTADSVIVSYAYEPGLLNEKNSQSVKWNDGSENSYLSSDYSPLYRGCGIGGACYFIETVKSDELIEVGKTTKGMKIYAAKDTKQRQIEEDGAPAEISPAADLSQTYFAYADMYQYLADEEGKKPLKTYEEFLKTHPIIYWQDPFGRYSAFIRNEVKPPAECGKPVIYLYPEKATKVDVKVDIDQFTKTEPAYGENGWSVIAQPNGELKNLADGLIYPYLFWEGISDKQIDATAGFVVEKKDLEKFLSDSLNKLGLNGQESADFMAFWLPKMQASNGRYLQVSFVGTSDFNKIAPLDISPKPDTLIRVFMYYQPLDKKISIPAQRLSAIPRRGFTVIEWGGTSSDGWQIK